MRAADVAGQRFRPTRFRQGYDQDEVDDFLDEVQQALDAHDRGGALTLTPEDVVAVRFQPTAFRPGYAQEDVDDFLDEVVLELRRRTSR